MNCVKTNRLTIMIVKRNGMHAGLTVTLTIPLIDEVVKSQNWDGKAPAAFRLFKIEDSEACLCGVHTICRIYKD